MNVLFAFLFFSLSIISTGFAQQTETPDQPKNEFKRHSLQLEVGGYGTLYSLNYDYLFSNNYGIQAGFGWFSFDNFLFLIDNFSNTTFAISTIGLWGSGEHKLEAGIGIMQADIKFKDFIGSSTITTDGIIPKVHTAYRFQSAETGTIYKVAIHTFPIFFGLTFGKAF